MESLWVDGEDRVLEAVSNEPGLVVFAGLVGCCVVVVGHCFDLVKRTLGRKGCREKVF